MSIEEGHDSYILTVQSIYKIFIGVNRSVNLYIHYIHKFMFRHIPIYYIPVFRSDLVSVSVNVQLAVMEAPINSDNLP